MSSDDDFISRTAGKPELAGRTASGGFRADRLLSAQDLGALSARRDSKGWGQLFGHLAVLGVSGWLWASQIGHWPVAVPALVVYGFGLASMFAPLHECVHRTAFASNRTNDAVAWFAGLLSFYNSTFYRRYHKWHHRYTQIPGKDPELDDPKPTHLGEYLVEISGLSWWVGKLRGHFRVAAGRLDNCPFIPETARAGVIRSVRLQLLVYAGAIALSLAAGQPWFWLYWLLPLAVGQPILRAILLAEHTGCSSDDNPLTNTRTTLTTWPVRFLMWNMPFHTEHHLHASIPFHALPAAHHKLRPHFAHLAAGYLKVNRDIVAGLG
ncbi:fatty acid desaturase family protein [Gloeobacter morelensis]|uniref:Fatty acid desaturase family protein n=1 Tax=Gloeobacter morelensis MG652769 TaxID=2781736 RepID=A0ABY3PRE3_9CYAN|nr:fatty acid desaturase family protein [Gloeobacter morelensis]UFP96281.1 fatty acid desaturase family protein [Gloeobacter morelensis MG652769]